MTINTILTRKAVETYEDRVVPTNFFTSMYGRKTPTEQLILSYDIKRKLERVAVDVAPGTGPKNIRKLEPFTNKEYQAPAYDEAFEFNANEFKKRAFGQTSYTPIQKAARFIEFVNKSWNESTEMIERAIELQCVNALLDGKLTLSNGDEIDFNQKSSHQITGTDWTIVGNNILANLQTGLDLIRSDGKGTGDVFVGGKSMIEGILSNTTIKDRADIRRIDSVNISRPAFNDAGAAFHGLLTVGSYTIELWSYPQSYEDAADATQDYLGDKQSILMDSRARMDLNFTGIDRFTSGNVEGTMLAGIPLVESSMVEFFPYSVMDKYGFNIQTGVESHPLAVPVAIDKVVVITSD